NDFHLDERAVLVAESVALFVEVACSEDGASHEGPFGGFGGERDGQLCQGSGKRGGPPYRLGRDGAQMWQASPEPVNAHFSHGASKTLSRAPVRPHTERQVGPVMDFEVHGGTTHLPMRGRISQQHRLAGADRTSAGKRDVVPGVK